jgi:hypothetical protein
VNSIVRRLQNFEYRGGGKMESTIEALLERNLLEVFNNNDAASRREVIAEIWAENCVFVAPEGIHHGRREVDETVGGLLAQFPGFRFAVDGVAQGQHGVGRISWIFGPPESPRQITGEDIGIIQDGRLATLYAFIDPSDQE